MKKAFLFFEGVWNSLQNRLTALEIILLAAILLYSLVGMVLFIGTVSFAPSFLIGAVAVTAIYRIVADDLHDWGIWEKSPITLLEEQDEKKE